VKYASPRGTRDILPEESALWQQIEKTCQQVFALYNYREIRTPLFESTELFSRSIGKTTDIVSKEMYTFTDRGDRSLTLRPEETAPVVRAALENNLIQRDQLLKLYYIGPMFRYERPQAGRYRQFYQAGVEAFGSADPTLDAEIVIMAWQIFEKLGLLDLEVDINSVGDEKCRPQYVEKLKAYFKDQEKALCEDCRVRLQVNPLRILDCKEAGCQKVIDKAPASADNLCPECKEHFEKVVGWLGKSGIKYKINHRLVRGLDYYTRTTFEVVSKQLGAQNAVCGGGRYDTLVEELGGKPTPAAGFAIGMDRLVEVLKSTGHLPAGRHGRTQSTEIGIYIATLGEEARKKGFEILNDLRQLGISADMDYIGKSLKSQLKAADQEKARFTLILGEEEIKSGLAKLKNMQTTKQEEVPCDARIIAAKLQLPK